MEHSLLNNEAIFQQNELTFHIDVAVYLDEDCKGVFAKCLPMDIELIRLLADNNITYETSFYIPPGED